MMVLAYDWTFDDLVRFCAWSTEYSVCSVDPTFSLGELEVTVMTYRHLLLRHRGKPHGQSPYLIGPLFVHLKKDFATYHYSASSLISLHPFLSKLKCFGTDGEDALVQAFSTAFSGAIHFRCFLHFRGNVEDKLRIPSVAAKEFVHDILGNSAHLETGLVDSENRADENGVSKQKGSPVIYVSIHTRSGNTNIFKRSKMGSHSHHYKLTRTYYRHTSSPDFTRIISTVRGKLLLISRL